MAVTVGVRELRNNLRSLLERVKAGEEVTVTEHGKPVARIAALRQSRLDELIEAGIVRPPLRPKRQIRLEDLPRIREGALSDIVIEQRR